MNIINNGAVRLSLLASRTVNKQNIIGVATLRDSVHAASGLNWGFSHGDSTPNSAYIRLSKDIVTNTFFAIPHANTNRRIIDAIWDDGIQMKILLEGSQDNNGTLFPKQMSSAGDKNILGRYLRTRIQNRINRTLVFSQNVTKPVLKSNPIQYSSHFITLSDLNLYGRTDIIATMINGVLHLDFS